MKNTVKIWFVLFVLMVVHCQQIFCQTSTWIPSNVSWLNNLYTNTIVSPANLLDNNAATNGYLSMSNYSTTYTKEMYIDFGTAKIIDGFKFAYIFPNCTQGACSSYPGSIAYTCKGNLYYKNQSNQWISAYICPNLNAYNSSLVCPMIDSTTFTFTGISAREWKFEMVGNYWLGGGYQTTTYYRVKDIYFRTLFQTPTFTKQSNISLTAVNYGNHECSNFVDINNDGFLDLFITGSTNTSGSAGFTGLYLNNGNNTFSSVPNLPFSGFFGSEGDWGDYNNDGYLDLLLSAESNGSPGGGGTRIYKNNGNNTFTQIFNINRGLCVSWGDYNNDGKLDFALAESGYYSSPYTIKIYKNDGNDSFSQDINIPFPSTTQSYSRIDWFDYNKDGLMDLVALRADSALLYKNNGNGTFSKVSSFNLPISGGSSSLAFVDYNNDGYIDIFKSDNKVYINNSGNGTFTAATLNAMSSFNGGNDWGDFNNDGRPDMLLSGNSPNLTKIYRNDGSNVFTDIGATITGISGNCL